MNILFLRGSVPPEYEHPEKLLYNSIEDCEDMWTQLFYYLTQKLKAEGELLYTNGDRKFKVDNTFTEKWLPSLESYSPRINPDLIICRGGFPYYDVLVKRYPKAKKVYYGAGVRFYPQTDYTDYDLFLVDSVSQLNEVKSKGKNAKLFIKPAAMLFSPIDVKKKFDLCFMANAPQAKLKRHELLLKSFANTNIKILNLGSKDERLMEMARIYKVDIKWGGWHLRKHLPALISKCKVGICCSTNYDSCPRVIPEYLACGLPVVVTENINFWAEKYITNQTGCLVNEDDILKGVETILHNYNYYNWSFVN